MGYDFLAVVTDSYWFVCYGEKSEKTESEEKNFANFAERIEFLGTKCCFTFMFLTKFKFSFYKHP